MDNDVQVTIAVHVKYHAFRLAEGLNEHNMLGSLYTIYPKSKIPPYKIPKHKTKSLYVLGALRFVNKYIGGIVSDNWIASVFDTLVALTLKRPESKNWIFLGFSGFCEKSLKKAKKLGAITLVERACPHIDFQTSLFRL